MKAANERKQENSGAQFRKLVKDPVISGGVRLDTVITASD
ncbi:hypothetical protein EVA_14490, partial [gut metagenome]